MGNSLILKEGKAFNLGDGKFSGIPKFEMMGTLGNFETLNFQTLGGNSERRDARNHKIENGAKPAFSIYSQDL